MIKKKDLWGGRLRSPTLLRKQLSPQELAASCWPQWPVLHGFVWSLRPPQSGSRPPESPHLGAQWLFHSITGTPPPHFTQMPQHMTSAAVAFSSKLVERREQRWENMEVAPLTVLSWMRSFSHIFSFCFTTGHFSLACNHILILQLPKVVSEGCLRIQILLETLFWPSKLVLSRLVHAACRIGSLEETVLWNMPRFCTEEIWSRTEADSRSTTAHCGWQVDHQLHLVPGNLLLNDADISSESQESTARITSLCHSIHISSCFIHLTEFPKKGKMASLSPVTGQGVTGTNWNLGHSIWTWGRTSLLWGWQSTGTGCPEVLWSLLLRWYSKPLWMWSCSLL